MIEEKDNTESAGGSRPVTRKEAIQKVGRYAAFTAAAMMLILDPAQGQEGGEHPPKKSPVKPRGGQKSAIIPKNTPPPSY